MDSYESEAHQKYVRRFLEGRFENSVFCLLAPDGQEWLTRASRGPQQVFGRQSASDEMNRYALRFPAKASTDGAIVQDFHTFRQALNVASADQRVLVMVNASANQESELRESLKAVANHADIVGRFHFDFDSTDAWKEKIEGTNGRPGIVLINPDEFGMKGSVMKQLPLDASTQELIASLKQANEVYVKTTTKKVYSSHVAKGKRAGVYFEGAVPYGEDRDGDGEIDRRGGGRR